MKLLISLQASFFNFISTFFTKFSLKQSVRFNEELEKKFDDDYFSKTLPIARVALVLAFILYAAFGILDVFISPITRFYTWIIRYAIVCPVMLAVFILSFFSFFKKIMQIALSVVALAGGFGIIAMIIIAQNVEGSLYYYAGLTLVIMWSYTFVRLKFFNATIVCWIILITYELSIIYFQGISKTPQLENAFLNNNFFFISANIIGMFVSYSMEMYSRRDFLQRQLIQEKQYKIEKEKNTLDKWRTAMDVELEMARNIQQRIIPESSPAAYISSIFKPMAPIGGDFYDFIKFREAGTTGIFISDVAGHGIPAALITTMIKSLISDSGSSKLDPANLLIHLNEILIEQTSRNHVTAFYGIYNKAGKTITYSNAGHNPPYLIYNNVVTELDKAGSMPLGLLANEDLSSRNVGYVNHVDNLPSGSKILLYTDGLTEARSRNEASLFFENEINEILVRLSALPCNDFIQALYGELVNFRGGDVFSDDVCIICIDVE